MKPRLHDLADAYGSAIADRIAPNLRVLFCGINPGLYSAATGYHFARPGNRFWPALFAGGFTDRQYSPCEVGQLLELGYGLTTLVNRATRSASDLSRGELQAGTEHLQEKVMRLQPRYLAFLGIGAYRVAFAQPLARVGLQNERIGSTRIWLLPEPSGLNAHFPPAKLGAAFHDLSRAIKASDFC